MPPSDLQKEATNQEEVPEHYISPERWEEHFTTHEGDVEFLDLRPTPKEAAGEAEDPADEKWLDDD